MKWFHLLLQAGLSQAALRFGCATVSVQRLDPLVEPGNIPSSHVRILTHRIARSHALTPTKVHQIVGGNAFNATMTGDIGEQGDCTTCAYTENHSNYWTASMYFRHENGSYKRVPQYPNAQLGTLGNNATDIKGGMTIYYTNKDFDTNGDEYITAFKPVSPKLPSVLQLVKRSDWTDANAGLPHDSRQPRSDHPQRLPTRPPVHLPPDHLDPWFRDTRLSQRTLPSWHHGHPPLPRMLGW
jgi:hypothetical protein